MLKTRLLLYAVWAFAVLVPPAAAMTVSPMQVEMVSVGSRNHALVTVVNNSEYPLPIEAVIQRMSHDTAGRAKVLNSSEDFLVMPPQAMIAPGATQNFRIQWLGEPMLDKSESFLLFLNQIPLKLPQGRAGVRVVMSMGVMINVAPPEGTPTINVVSTGIATGKDGKRYPTLTVENTSNVHALLPQATIQLAAGDWSATLTPQEIGDRIGIGLVQPGRRRQFMLPVELPRSATKVKARVEISERRP